MTVSSITLFDVQLAYKKLKSNVYYDNYDLFTKSKIADFETTEANFNTNSVFDIGIIDIDDRLKNLWSHLNKKNITESDYFKNKISNISARVLPKELDYIGASIENIYKNSFPLKDYEVFKVNYFIDAEIELVIISVLWLMKIGYKLEKGLYEKAYGNRLSITKNKKLQDGLSLFKPYFGQYQRWRNEAIDKVEELIKNEENAAIINLDIKGFFYHACISEKTLNKSVGELDPSLLELHQLFIEINKAYTLKIKGSKHHDINYDEIINNGCFILPIGLPSSYVLANWHMNNFDKRILQEVKPIYYSRYVDDILIVINNPDFDKNNQPDPCDALNGLNGNSEKLSPIDRFIYEELKPLLEISIIKSESNLEPDKYEFKIICDEYNLLTIQEGKTFLYLIDAKESTHFLDRIKKELLENSSEFRDLPNDEEDFPDYNEETFDAVFSGKGKKSDKILGLKNSKFVLTVFLANRIFAALKQQSTYNIKESRRIISFFKAANAIDYYQLWERIFVYLIVHNDKKGFLTFYTNILITISELKISSDLEAITEGFKNNLLVYLRSSAEIALALKPRFFDSFMEEEISKCFNQGTGLGNVFSPTDNKINWKKFRISNMVRDKYVVHSLLNYTNLAFNTDISLIEINIPVKVDDRYLDMYQFDAEQNNLSLNDNLKKYSPRLVKFFEVSYYYQYSKITDDTAEVEAESVFVYQDNIKLEYLSKSFDLYFDFNYTNLYSDITSHSEMNIRRLKMQEKIFLVESTSFNLRDVSGGRSTVINEVRINLGLNNFKECKLSIANIKCNEEYFNQSMEGTPVINSDRYKTFSTILNLTKNQNADLLGMPECSVPYDLVPAFAKFCSKHNLCCVMGLEHWRVENISYNFIVTIIPMKIESSYDAIVIYRLKNHYSHEEARHILTSGSDLKVPIPKEYRYDLVNWRNLYFTNFYCYELANILHRSLFVSTIDLMVASEWNSDVNYFSGIVETTSREIHCYFMQVNTSQFGDSRITLPAKTESKNQIQIKGGENDTVLIGQIDIPKLRKFQYKKYDKQKEDKAFKPTPPDFNRKNVRKRMNNEFIFKHK